MENTIRNVPPIHHRVNRIGAQTVDVTPTQHAMPDLFYPNTAGFRMPPTLLRTIEAAEDRPRPMTMRGRCIAGSTLRTKNGELIVGGEEPRLRFVLERGHETFGVGEGQFGAGRHRSLAIIERESAIGNKLVNKVHANIVQPQVDLRSSGNLQIVDIADVKAQTGLTSATLHHYESIGLIAPTGRIGLRRQYADSVIETLAVIVLCQRSGFTLEEVTHLLARQRNAEWKSMARTKLSEIDERIAALEDARDGLRHALDCKSRDIMRCEHFQARLSTVFAP